MVFALFKVVYYDKVDWLEQENVNTIDKKYFTFLYSFMRKKIFMVKNIKVDFAINNLFSYNLDKMLRNIFILVIKLAISRVNKVKVKPY